MGRRGDVHRLLSSLCQCIVADSLHFDLDELNFFWFLLILYTRNWLIKRIRIQGSSEINRIRDTNYFTWHGASEEFSCLKKLIRSTIHKRSVYIEKGVLNTIFIGIIYNPESSTWLFFYITYTPSPTMHNRGRYNFKVKYSKMGGVIKWFFGVKMYIFGEKKIYTPGPWMKIYVENQLFVGDKLGAKTTII